MASAFDQMAAEMAAPLLAEQFGQAVIYAQPNTGGEVRITMTVSLGPVQTLRRQTERGLVYESVRTALFSTDPASPGGGVAAPLIGDEIEVGEETWYVREITHLSGSACRAELVRKDSHERGKARYVG
jgi:hypothetical protein